MSRSPGVRGRLVLTTALITTGAMALMLVVVLLAANQLMASQVQTALDDRIDTVAASLAVRQGRVEVPDVGADTVLDGVWVFDASGVQVSGPDASARTTAVVDGLAEVRQATTLKRGERLFRARPVAVPGPDDLTAVVVATESLDVYEASRDILLGALGVAALLVVAGTAATTAWTVSRTLRRVGEMTESADEWSAHDLEARFDLTGDDELARLGRTLDRLLDRVAQAIRAEQRLTGELAHELRTPLTALRGEAELALLGTPPPDVRERFVRVLEQVDRLNGTITALLEVARHSTGSPRQADVGEVVAALVAARPPADVRTDVAAAAGLHVAAAAELVERIVGPVVDNAVRHARTRVEVVVRRRAGRVVVEVSDDGAGLDAAHGEDVFRAGFRRSDDTEGAGLGLPLARRVAATVGGTVSVTSAHDPTTFTIDLPPA
jgi:signal transduction histidine kinase